MFPLVRLDKISDKITIYLHKFTHTCLEIYTPSKALSQIIHFRSLYGKNAAVEPSDAALDVVCWTPKLTGDNIERAGAQLFKVLVYNMDFVEENEEQSNIYINEAWEDNWYATNNCLKISREIGDVE